MTTYQVLGIIAGLSSGFIWEKLATDKFGHFRTLLPSLFIKEGSTSIHLHHWVVYAIILIILIIAAYKTERLAHPAVLFLIFSLSGGILFDFLVFRDFLTFITRIYYQK